MATIKEAYVSVDIAQLLRDKGFDVPIRTFFNIRKDNSIRYNSCKIDHNANCNHLSCPTQQMVMAWLTAVKGIVIEIRVRHNTGLNGLPLFEYQYCIYNGMDKHLDRAHFFEKREACIDEAIRYCLENLI